MTCPPPSDALAAASHLRRRDPKTLYLNPKPAASHLWRRDQDELAALGHERKVGRELLREAAPNRPDGPDAARLSMQRLTAVAVHVGVAHLCKGARTHHAVGASGAGAVAALSETDRRARVRADGWADGRTDGPSICRQDKQTAATGAATGRSIPYVDLARVAMQTDRQTDRNKDRPDARPRTHRSAQRPACTPRAPCAPLATPPPGTAPRSCPGC
jgi:hypothetical protein